MLASAVSPAIVDGVFVGIDWGNDHHQLCVVDAAGAVVEQGKITHDVAGLHDLQRRLDRYELVGVAIERSEGLLVETLQANGGSAGIRRAGRAPDQAIRVCAGGAR
jgi:transposase